MTMMKHNKKLDNMSNTTIMTIMITLMKWTHNETTKQNYVINSPNDYPINHRLV